MIPVRSVGPIYATVGLVSPWNFKWISWRRTLAMLLVVCSGLGAAALLVLAAKMLLALFLGVVLAVAVRPMMEKVMRLGLPRGASTALVFVVVAAVAVVGLALAAPLVRTQLQTFTDSGPLLCSRAVNLLPSRVFGAERLFDFTRACTRLIHARPSGKTFTPSSFSAVPAALWTLTLILGAAFVWARDREHLLRSTSMFFAEAKREGFRTLFEGIEARLGAFLQAQLILSGVVALVTAGFCLAFGVPNTLLIVTLSLFAEALPLVGPLAVFGVALLSVAGPHPELMVVVLVFCITLRILVDYLFMPYLVGRTAEVNPLLLLVCILSLGTAGGVLGIAAAAPLAAVIQLLLSLTPKGQSVVRDTAHRGRWSVLAYQANVTALAARRLGRERVGSGKSADFEDAVEALAIELRAEMNRRNEEAN